MTQNCTLFCSAETAEQLLKIAVEAAQSNNLEVEGDKQNWLAFRFKNAEMSMIVKRLQKESDEQFAGIQEAILSFVKEIDTKHQENQSNLVNLLAKCTQLFPITVEPIFDETSEDIVFEMMEAGQGVLFTGNEFLNFEGGLVLDIEGSSEEGTLFS